MRTALIDRPIDLSALVAEVARTANGATILFVGTVREVNNGRAITGMDYTAYASMAKKEMERIAEEIEREIEGARVCAIHRIGTLGVGDAAIVCAASAPHRGEAFKACRELIDRIKARVPIWKREWGPHGAAWVGWEDARCEPGHHHDHHH